MGTSPVYVLGPQRRNTSALSSSSAVPGTYSDLSAARRSAGSLAIIVSHELHWNSSRCEADRG